MVVEPLRRSEGKLQALLKGVRDPLSDTSTHPDTRWRRTSRGVSMVLLALAILWTYVAVTEGLMQPRGPVTELSFLQPTAPGGSALPVATRHGYGVNVFNPGASSYTLTGDIGSAMESYDDPAILIPRARRIVTAKLDGVALATETRVPQLHNYATFRPQLFRIPPEISESVDARGGRTLELHATSVLTQPYVAMPVMGEYDDLLPATRWRVRIGYDLAMLSSAVCLVITLIGLVMGLERRRRYQWWSFAVVALCWGIINLYYVGAFSPLSPVIGQVVMAVANYLLIIASLAFVNEWTLKIGWMRKWLIPFLLVIAVGKSLPVLLTGGTAMGWVRIALELVAVVAVLAMIYMLSAGYAQRKTASAASALVFLVALFAVSFDIFTAAVPDAGFAIWPATGQTVHAGTPMSLIMGLTVIGAFARGYIESQRVLSTANAQLARELDEREAEIRAVYRTRAAEMREAALVEERKRIMRDMHDGIGGNLLSLSLRARSGDLAGPAVADELSHSLQQLRLVVDSLDTAGDDLDIALGALRARIEPALRAAGMELCWRIGDLGEDTRYGPQQVLDVYRIIQEASANAMRHSGADRLEITAERKGNVIRIEVIDDGSGMSEDALPGKGLESLESRARRLGGQMDIASRPGHGTTVGFDLPADPPPSLPTP